MPEQNKAVRKKKGNAPDLDSLGAVMGGNVPPQALEAEEAVLGAMLLESSSVDRAM